jgi:hypothetical protein
MFEALHRTYLLVKLAFHNLRNATLHKFLIVVVVLTVLDQLGQPSDALYPGVHVIEYQYLSGEPHLFAGRGRGIMLP